MKALFIAWQDPKNRPEYKDYLNWLGLSDSKYDELEELARTGGLRATDMLELFPCPKQTPDKNYEVYFFCRGLRHLHKENQQRARRLEPGERLYLMQDLQIPAMVWRCCCVQANRLHWSAMPLATIPANSRK